MAKAKSDEKRFDLKDQAVDTPLPTDYVDVEAFKNLQELYDPIAEDESDSVDDGPTIRRFMTETLYPWGYQRALVTLSRLKELCNIGLMEPEAAERFFAEIVSRNGQMGVGGAHRTTQPSLPGFAPDGQSFHQDQRFSDGKVSFMAFDLVMRNGDNIHRSPTWSEVPKQGTGHPDTARYGVHANVDGEPWHLQCFEVDGWQTWVNNGRKHPNPNFAISGQAPSPTPAPTPTSAPTHAYYPGERTLRLTSPVMQGIDIAYLQQALTRKGLKLDDDGVYGPVTVAAVKTMQGWNGLEQDGIVADKTWPVVISYNNDTVATNPNNHPLGSRVMYLTSPTMQGQDVLWLQNVIKNQKLTVSIDGVFGRQTRDRVITIQGWNKLKQDGVVGPVTLEVLKKY